MMKHFPGMLATTHTSFAMVVKLNRPFKYVGILGGVVGSRIRVGNADKITEVLQKHTVVGTFSTARRFPAGFKFRISHREVE